MLNLNTIEIQDLLSKSFSTVEEQKKIISIALAISVSKKALLPNSYLDHISLINYYNESVLKELTSLVYSFNEQIIVDTSYVLELCKSNWFIRFNAAYPDIKKEIIVNEDYDFYSKVFGIDDYISLDDYKLTNLNKFVLFSLINKISRILNT